MRTWNDWNELVAPDDIIPTTKKNNRRSSIQKPTHIVIHITGTDSFESVKKTFLSSVSAHYLIDKQGRIYQFVKDCDRAWHAGIRSSQKRLYKRANIQWMNYLWYFKWYRGYPGDAVYVDEDLNNVRSTDEASFVRMPTISNWKEYEYFKERWPGKILPINFETDSDPNNYSIGIECLTYGSKSPDSSKYTDQMYKALDKLIENLCGKYDILRSREYVVGHEDVNPLARFGWDPNSGFEWGRIV